MYNTDIPNREELPSTAKLIRSTIMAAIVALVLLVTVVMPAEYALDPTGAGRLLGLTEMGEIKEQLAEEAAADEEAQMVAVQSSSGQHETEAGQPEAEESTQAAAPEPETLAEEEQQASTSEPATSEPQWQDEVRVVLTPGEGTEFKLTMEEGAVAQFSWVSEGGPINFDTHGDGNGQSISYEKGRGVPEDEGELEAAFTGNHGWFFRNRNDNDITLVLRTDGEYGQLKKML
jgi:glucan-binding YG repeat protein|tara:strand:- start:2815 stop:3510 length:696 start_codon:yes stop_codon:yes gene_type:complete